MYRTIAPWVTENRLMMHLRTANPEAVHRWVTENRRYRLDIDAPEDIEALARHAQEIGADGIAIANSAIQAIGCIAARICNTNNCPSGIATQQPELRRPLDVDASALKLARFLGASVELMQVMARACGHAHLNAFSRDDLATCKPELAQLSGIAFAGVAL